MCLSTFCVSFLCNILEKKHENCNKFIGIVLCKLKKQNGFDKDFSFKDLYLLKNSKLQTSGRRIASNVKIITSNTFTTLNLHT